MGTDDLPTKSPSFSKDETPRPISSRSKSLSRGSGTTMKHEIQRFKSETKTNDTDVALAMAMVSGGSFVQAESSESDRSEKDQRGREREKEKKEKKEKEREREKEKLANDAKEIKERLEKAKLEHHEHAEREAREKERLAKSEPVPVTVDAQATEATEDSVPESGLDNVKPKRSKFSSNPSRSGAMSKRLSDRVSRHKGEADEEKSTSSNQETSGESESTSFARRPVMKRNSTQGSSTASQHSSAKWTMEQVNAWLTENDLSALVEILSKNSVEAGAVMTLTMEDLEQYQVPNDLACKFKEKVFEHNQSLNQKTEKQRISRFRFPTVELRDLNNRDWWDYVSHEEMWAVDKASIGRKKPSEPARPVLPWLVKESPSTLEDLKAWNVLTCVEYEDTIVSARYLARTKELGKELDPLFTFPPKDVTVTVAPFYTITPPNLKSLTECPNHILLISDYFHSERFFVQCKSKDYGGSLSLKQRVTQGFKRMSQNMSNVGQSLIAGPRPKRLSMNKYGTVTHANNSSAVKLDKIPDLYSQLVNEASEKVLAHEQTFREKCHQNVFLNFGGQQELPEHPTDKRVFHDSAMFDRKDKMIMIEAKHFALNIFPEEEQKEPWWISIAFYDIKNRVKLSEDFHFEFNDGESINTYMGRFYTPNPDKETFTKRAIFKFGQVHDLICLVVKVRRVLKGTVDDIIEPYTSGSKPPEKRSWLSENASNIGQFGKYQQYFVWSIIPAFTSDGTLALSDAKKIDLYKMKPLCTNEAIYDFGREVLVEAKAKLPKALKGHLILSAMELKAEKTPTLTNMLDESLHSLPPHPNAIPSVISQPVKDIFNFVAYDQKYPHLRLLNNFYIYPNLLNLEKFPSKLGKVKHIIVRVSCYSDDNSLTPVPCIYGRTRTSNLVASLDLAMVWGEKKPTFCEEIKIKLPFNLTESFHVVFHVSSFDPKGEGDKETLLCHYAMPILNENAVIGDGEHRLLAFTSFAKGYLGTLSKVGLSDCPFVVSTKLASSLYSQDKVLADFYLLNQKREIKKWVHVEHISEQTLVKCFPIIFHNLLYHMVTQASKNMQQLAFRSLINCVRRIDRETTTRMYGKGGAAKKEPSMTNANTGTQSHAQNVANLRSLRDQDQKAKHYLNTFLTSFVAYHMNMHTQVEALHDSIVKNWLILINESGLSSEAKNLKDFSFDSYALFLFSLVIKSMTLYLHENNLLGADRKNAFPKEYLSNLTDLVTNFASQSSIRGSKNGNRHFAYFICDLFNIMDRGFVCKLIGLYLTSGEHCDQSNERCIKFLRLISDYEHYVPLILPFETPVDTATMLETKIWKNHYIAGFLHDILARCVVANEGCSAQAEKNRWKTIKMIRHLLWKHDLDPRYTDAAKKLLVNVYIPILSITVRNVRHIKNFNFKNGAVYQNGEVEQRDWFVCCLYVLRTADSNLIRQWLVLEKDRFAMLEVMTLMLEAFKVHPLFDEMSLIICDWLDFILIDNSYELNQAENVLHLEQICRIYLLLLKCSSDPNILKSIFCALRNLYFRFRYGLFREKVNALVHSDFAFEIISIVFEYGLEVAKSGASLLYAMLKANFFESGEVFKMKLALTVAIAKIDKSRYLCLPRIFDVILSYTKNNPIGGSSSQMKEWERHIKDLMGRLYRSVTYQLALEQNVIQDRELKADIMISLEKENNHSVDQRVKWLVKLKDYYEAQEEWPSMGHCLVTIACIIALTLQRKNEETLKIPLRAKKFAHFHPGIVFELPPTGACTVEALSPIFSEQGYQQTMEDALAAYEKAQLFETCLALSQMTFNYYLKKAEYVKLGELAKNKITGYCEAAAQANKGDTRLFSNFYRVGFYGKKFKEMNEAQMIYSAKASVRLTDFVERLTKQFASMLEEEIKILPNKPRDKLDINPDLHYLQVISVDGYKRADVTETLTTFEKKNHVHEFFIETPWNPDGGPISEDVDKQWKLRTIFECGRYLPGIYLRLPVLSQRTEPVTPLESSIDLIASRIVAIKKELGLQPPNTKTLQMVLQGSIMLQVNAGPLAICRVFLGNADKFDRRRIMYLKALMTEFLLKCRFALVFNKNLIKEIESGQDAYQAAMEEAFKKLNDEAEQYISQCV